MKRASTTDALKGKAILVATVESRSSPLRALVNELESCGATVRIATHKPCYAPEIGPLISEIKTLNPDLVISFFPGLNTVASRWATSQLFHHLGAERPGLPLIVYDIFRREKPEIIRLVREGVQYKDYSGSTLPQHMSDLMHVMASPQRKGGGIGR